MVHIIGLHPMINSFFWNICPNYHQFLKEVLSVFLTEGGSADYIVTGAWSAKAAKEVNFKEKYLQKFCYGLPVLYHFYIYVGELSDVHLGRALSCMVLSKLDVWDFRIRQWKFKCLINVGLAMDYFNCLDLVSGFYCWAEEKPVSVQLFGILCLLV